MKKIILLLMLIGTVGYSTNLVKNSDISASAAIAWNKMAALSNSLPVITNSSGVLVSATQTGTGSKFVMDTSPTLVTPTLGVASATSINKMAITAPATSSTLAVADGKTLTCSNTLTLAGTDGSTLNVGAGGTLGTAAYTATSAYEVPLTFSTGLTRTTNTITVNTSQNISTLSNLTSNGYVKTSGGGGALSIQSTPIPVTDSTVANQALTTCTTSRTIDWSTGNSFTLTLTNGDACAISFSNATSGQTINIDLTQPSSSGGTATVTWATTTKWNAGSAPTITTGNSATDSCTIKYNGTDYRGSCVQNFQ